MSKCRSEILKRTHFYLVSHLLCQIYSPLSLASVGLYHPHCSCFILSDKMRFMLNLALKLELKSGGKIESPLVARLENHLWQGRLHQKVGW